MIPVALNAAGAQLSDRDIVHFVDNTVGLYAMVKGVSNQTQVQRAAQVAHLICFSQRANPWFEFVESKSNWSDSISRN